MLLSRKNFLLNGRKLSLLNYLLTLLRVCQVNRQSIKVLNVLLSFFNGTFEVFSTTTYASEHGIMSLFISISRYKKNSQNFSSPSLSANNASINQLPEN